MSLVQKRPRDPIRAIVVVENGHWGEHFPGTMSFRDGVSLEQRGAVVRGDVSPTRSHLRDEPCDGADRALTTLQEPRDPALPPGNPLLGPLRP